jgi:hypothetical protein
VICCYPKAKMQLCTKTIDLLVVRPLHLCEFRLVYYNTYLRRRSGDDAGLGLLFLSTIHIQIHTHLKWGGYG